MPNCVSWESRTCHSYTTCAPKSSGQTFGSADIQPESRDQQKEIELQETDGIASLQMFALITIFQPYL